MAAEYRLLKDHYIGTTHHLAGETISPAAWSPTADVDPLNTEAVSAFYDMGPQLPGIMNSQWSNHRVPAPVTYWFQVAPDYWALSGLGSNQRTYPPVRAYIGRVE